MTVATGADLLVGQSGRQLEGKRCAFLGNQTSVTRDLICVWQWLHDKGGLDLLLGPEHGFWSVKQDMVSVDDMREPLTSLPVTSLYGDNESSLAPSHQALRDIDVVVCDIQDVGARYYTYVWTMAHCMKVCADLGKKMIVLDLL